MYYCKDGKLIQKTLRDRVSSSLKILQISGPGLDKLLQRLVSSIGNYYGQSSSLTFLGSLCVWYTHRRLKLDLVAGKKKWIGNELCSEEEGKNRKLACLSSVSGCSPVSFPL